MSEAVNTRLHVILDFHKKTRLSNHSSCEGVCRGQKICTGFHLYGGVPHPWGGPYLLKTKSLVAPFWRNRELKIASYRM